MKILLLTKPDKGEYLSDMVLHGFRELGIEITDYPRLWYMYEKDLTADGFNPIGNVSGNGFTVFGTLPEDTSIDRLDLQQKIKTTYYDFVIFARADFTYDLEELVFSHYPTNKIIWLDGHDVQQLFSHRLGKGIYFKREKVDTSNTFPISFAIPEKKILLYEEEKTKNVSDIVPGQTTLGTYKFLTEESYYKEYAKSYLALTMKKSGWDCMRHYEIIANGCVPVFLDIEHCPQLTMTNLPKNRLKEVLDIVKQPNGTDKFISDKSAYMEYRSFFLDHLKNNCTTKDMAKYILDVANYIYK